MKSIYELTDEIIDNAPIISTYDKTKILVFSSYIIDKPYRSHRLELKMYSIRYKEADKCVYIYNKYDDYFAIDDIDCVDEFEITEDYYTKIYIMKSIKDMENRFMKFIKRVINKIRMN